MEKHIVYRSSDGNDGANRNSAAIPIEKEKRMTKDIHLQVHQLHGHVVRYSLYVSRLSTANLRQLQCPLGTNDVIVFHKTRIWNILVRNVDDGMKEKAARKRWKTFPSAVVQRQAAAEILKRLLVGLVWDSYTAVNSSRQ